MAFVFFRCLVDREDFKERSPPSIFRGVVFSCFHEWCLSFDSVAASEEDLAIKKHVAIRLMRSHPLSRNFPRRAFSAFTE